MSSEKYEDILRQAREGDDEEKTNCILTMLAMIGTNHLPCLDLKVKKLKKMILVVGIGLILAVLFQEQISMGSILALLGKFL